MALAVKQITHLNERMEMTQLDHQIILINVSGQDKPGLMAWLMGTLEQYGARVLDIGQAVIHSDLALGLLVKVSESECEQLVAKLKEQADGVGSELRVTEVSHDQYNKWLAASGQKRFILTILTKGEGAAALHATATQTHHFALNIDTIRRLTDRGDSHKLDRGDIFCVEMRIRGNVDAVDELRQSLMQQSLKLDFDFSLQEDTVFRRNRRLVAFDMDSTLITQEVMDELAVKYGIGEQVAAITERAMQGELDFQASFRKRAALLKGMPVSLLDEVATEVELNLGARRLILALKHFGYKVALISSGFQYVGEYLQQQLGIDYVYANNLVQKDGVMTGEVDGPIVDAQRKAELLKEMATQENIALQQTIAIGDGANDLPMLAAAGLGVAYHAKPVVLENAQHAISNFGLDAILYLIGFSDRDIDQALQA